VVDAIAEKLGNVNNSNRITPDFKFQISDHPSLVRYERFYDHFTQVMLKEQRADPTLTSTRQTTPTGQNTVPLNPQYSSSTESTSSRESKPEHHTQAAAGDFLWAALKTVEHMLQNFSWYQDGNYNLEHT
jgi:hypothetical protein